MSATVRELHARFPGFVLAAAAVLARAATARLWPLIDTRAMDRTAAVYWAEPHLADEIAMESGPVGPVVVTHT